ncbi:hypothetical protein AVEN_153135-1, partial [Araneus ventricosus]
PVPLFSPHTQVIALADGLTILWGRFLGEEGGDLDGVN